MTSMDLVGVTLITLALLGGFAVSRRMWRNDRARWSAVGRTHGAARCQLIVQILCKEMLKNPFDERRCSEFWDMSELLLVEALPDCPPDLKPELREVCDALVRLVRNRDLAKRIMAVRNSVIPA